MSEAEYIIEDLKDVISQLKVCSDDVLTNMYKIKYKLNTRNKFMILNHLSQLYDSISSLEFYIDNLEDQI